MNPQYLLKILHNIPLKQKKSLFILRILKRKSNPRTKGELKLMENKLTIDHNDNKNKKASWSFVIS